MLAPLPARAAEVLSDLGDREFGGNAVRTWLMAAGIAGGVIVAFWLVRMVLVSRLARLAKRTETVVDDLLVECIRGTRLWLVILLALAAASVVLDMPGRDVQAIRIVAVFAILIQSAFWGHVLVDFGLRAFARRHPGSSDQTTLYAMGLLARIALGVVLLLLALENLHVNVTALITGLGIGGIAIALALQNILGDLFGAISIVLDKPFVVGDAIVVGEVSGVVEHIGLKTTRIRSDSGEQVIVANADLLRSRVRNYARVKIRRVVIKVTVGFDTPAAALERIPAMVRDVVEAIPRTLYLRGTITGMSALGIEVDILFDSMAPELIVAQEARQAALLGILRRFEASGIRLASAPVVAG